MNETIQTFDSSIDLKKAILWQYDRAERLEQLIEEKQAWYDANQRGFWEDWYNDVFNLATADYFGLSVWAIILGMPIVFNNTGDPSQISWGFDVHHKNFNRGNFARTTGFTYVLSAAGARALLQLRYFQLTSSGTVPETNRMLKYVFGDQGVAYLVDNGDMTQQYIFKFPLSAELEYIFKNLDILPRPAGVSSSFDVIL